MNAFNFRDQVISSYEQFSRSFVRIAADDIKAAVDSEYGKARYWPEPLIQINPNYKKASTIDELAAQGVVHQTTADIFRVNKDKKQPEPVRLHKHQEQALAIAAKGSSYVVTTGTGSGKSLAFFIPIADQIIKAKEKDPTRRTRAIVIYPMNALANSQLDELGKFLADYDDDKRPLTVARYTGQENQAERRAIVDNPPDILLTNFMMLELILTRFDDVDSKVVSNCSGLEFLVLDELHTYRGRQGADVAMLVRRLRQRLKADKLICVGTSATMSSGGSVDDRKQTVARVASRLFGTEISDSHIVGETLERATDTSLDIKAVRPLLAKRLEQPSGPWTNLEDFRKDPLAVWTELTLGLNMDGADGPERAKPLSLSDAVNRLLGDAGLADDKRKYTQQALEAFLTAAQEVKGPADRAIFAFKIHQFISGPGKVLCTLEPDHTRQITLDAQRFAPGRKNEQVQLYSTHFCRECGQEYHPVWESPKSTPNFTPREIDDVGDDEQDRQFGFIAPIRDGQEYTGMISDLPDSWLEAGKEPPKLKQTYAGAQPTKELIDAQGSRGSGTPYWFIPGKFRFCLNCGYEHQAHGRDINRLSGLSGEGRSSATTILTLAILRRHFGDKLDPNLGYDPRKLLGFSDNRQDAALQAGHFNDFLFLLLMRAGLLAALSSNKGELQAGEIGNAVFNALGFNRNDRELTSEYLRDPDLYGFMKDEADSAARFMLSYRMIHDLRKGWRYNNPNLRQLDLLHVEYRHLDSFTSKDEAFSQSAQPEHLETEQEDAWELLRKLNPASRTKLAKLVFDALLRDLCLRSDFLTKVDQEKVQPHTAQLTERWGIGQDEKLVTSKSLILDKRPETRGKKKRDDLIGGGPRSKLIREIRYHKDWGDDDTAASLRKMKGTQLVELVRAFLHASSKAGYTLRKAISPECDGWMLNDTALLWKLNPKPSSEGQANEFFRDLYLSTSSMLENEDATLFQFEAREHTAQVDADQRKILEARFRMSPRDEEWWKKESGISGPITRLPVLYCSPTMELGVDISALNTVYMRNVPPTPANYAQRSGRAGRSGQAALVITYCAAMSPHDQWFYHKASEMVHGVVKPPTLDLTNQRLIESHMHAVWLSSVHHPINTSIAPLLDLDKPDKPLLEELRKAIEDPGVAERALVAIAEVLEQIKNEVSIPADYAESIVKQSLDSLSKAFDRWRALYDATLDQMDKAQQLLKSHTTDPKDREPAKRRHSDASNQLKLLLRTGGGQNNDFYTFRYLASQGFLPGYNFPRLPLMAWIPPTKGSKGAKDEEGNMISRPRFLALSEFGPRSLIYHQGRMFRVTRAKLSITGADQTATGARLPTLNALVCSECGYGHMGKPESPDPKQNVCDHCQAPLDSAECGVQKLYRIETVETEPVQRISVNEEERQRQGFDIITTFQFLPGIGGKPERSEAAIQLDGETIANMTYSNAAAIWRINKGWRRRKNKKQLGFYINPIDGRWSKKESPEEETDGNEQDENSLKKVEPQQIVPFVEDYRNILILRPPGTFEENTIATLQAALKRGIEQVFEIEASELAVEPLPSNQDRRALLFYESAEGGAGVLNQLVGKPDALRQVARTALEVMHYDFPEDAGPQADELKEHTDPQTGAKICEAGCYQCILSYFNQPDHVLIDRTDEDAIAFLCDLANCDDITAETVEIETGNTSNSPLATWLQTLSSMGLRQPDETEKPVNGGEFTADAVYTSSRALIFLTPQSEQAKTYATDRGFTVIEFPEDANDWKAVFSAHPEVFGPITESV